MPSAKRAPAATLPMDATPPNPPGNPPPAPDPANPPHQYALLDIIHQAKINPHLQVDAFAGVPSGMFTAERISIVTSAYCEYRMMIIASHPEITLLGLKVGMCVTFHHWNPELNDETICMEMKMTESEVWKGRKNLQAIGLYAIQRRKKGKYRYTAMMLPILMRGEELEAWKPGFIRNRWDSRDRRLELSESESLPGDNPPELSDSESLPGDNPPELSDSESLPGDQPPELSDSESFSLAEPRYIRTLDDDEINHHHQKNVDHGSAAKKLSESESLPGDNPPELSESESLPGDTLARVDALIAAYQIPPPEILKGTGIPLAEYRPAVAAALLQSGVTPDDVTKAIEEGIPKSKGIYNFPRWLPTAAARERDIRIQAESDKARRPYAEDRENRNALRDYRQEREREKHRKMREKYSHLFNR